jgi:hypothetical protein
LRVCVSVAADVIRAKRINRDEQDVESWIVARPQAPRAEQHGERHRRTETDDDRSQGAGAHGRRVLTRVL